MPRLLTTQEAANYIGMSRQFLERDRWKGNTIPFVVIGTRSVRYRQEDLDEYLEKQTIRPNGRGKHHAEI